MERVKLLCERAGISFAWLRASSDGSSIKPKFIKETGDSESWRIEGNELTFVNGGVCCILNFEAYRKASDLNSIASILRGQKIDIGKGKDAMTIPVCVSMICLLESHCPESQNHGGIIGQFDLACNLKDTSDEAFDSQLTRYFSNWCFGGEN
eukprot:751472-Hanusia_phi.AAC.7